MRYLKDVELPPGTINTLVIEHRGEELHWNTRTFRKLKMDDYTVIDINKYWELLPIETQDKIFAIYKQILEAFETTEVTKRLDAILTPLVTELYKYHRYEDIANYFHKHAKVKMYEELSDTYTNGLEPDLTYLKKDYVGLVILTIALKPMIPIFGQYISTVQAEVGNQFKEYVAAGLLRQTDIVKSPGYERLAVYINAYWEGDVEDFSSAAVLSGLDKAQVPEWLLGIVLIRRIAVARLIQTWQPDTPTVIITDIYNLIKSQVNTFDKSFGGRVNEKGLDRGIRGDDDDNTSVIENYKIKQEVAEGIIATHDVFLKTRGLHILKRIDETCPEKLYHDIKKKFFTHLTTKDAEGNMSSLYTPESFTITLIKWTLDPVVTARSIDEISFDAILEGAFVTHALLTHWGYKHIAIMLFAERQRTSSSALVNMVRTELTDEQYAELEKIYPHTPNTILRRKTAKYESNVGVRAIRTLLSQFYSSWWKIAPWEQQKDYPDLTINNERVIPLPTDMERVLADFIIFTRGTNHVKLYPPINA